MRCVSLQLNEVLLLLIAVVNFLTFIIFFTIKATTIAKEIVSETGQQFPVSETGQQFPAYETGQQFPAYETGQQFPVYTDCTSYIPVTNCTSYISIKS